MDVLILPVVLQDEQHTNTQMNSTQTLKLSLPNTNQGSQPKPAHSNIAIN